jgi:dihydroceramide fatty acyl 2-hydroxylase
MSKGYVRHTRARMFESDFFEFFSKIHPSTPFIFYIPQGIALLSWALVTGVTSPLAALAMFPLGWVFWQVMEYFIHGYVFHWEGNGPFTRRMHEILHGYHHKYPDDDTRLVMPLGASIPMVVGVGGLLYLLDLPKMTVPFFVGALFGYLWYDFIHWSTHFRKPLTEWGKRMRSAHMAHHFADHTVNMGISHMWIDLVLGTRKVRKATEPDADVNAT